MARKKTTKPAKSKTPPKRPRYVEDDDDSDDIELLDDYDDYDEPVAVKPPSKNNAYTGLSLLTMVALLGAAVLFYLDAEAAKAQPLSAPSVTIPALTDAANP